MAGTSTGLGGRAAVRATDRGGRAWRIALGAAVAVVAVGVGLTVGSPRVPGSPVAPAPLPKEQGSYVADVPSFVAVSRDGRTLSVLPVYGPCGEQPALRLVATEHPRDVALHLVVQGHRDTEAQLRHELCLTAIFGGRPWVSVRLTRPLGLRVVVQASSGQPIPAYGGVQVARATVLPKGCQPGPLRPASDVLTDAPPYPSGSHPGLTWTCEVAVPFPPRYPGTPAAMLEVGQWQGWVRSLGLPIEERTSVRGHPALVKVLRVGAVDVVVARSISWREDNQTFVVTSSSGLSQTVAHSSAVLSASALVRIADGLRTSSAPTPGGWPRLGAIRP